MFIQQIFIEHLLHEALERQVLGLGHINMNQTKYLCDTAYSLIGHIVIKQEEIYNKE